MTRRGLAAAAAVTAVLLASAQAHAHRLDEYLQATRISLGLDRINLEIDLTPGVTIAGKVGTDIDTNQDNVFSTGEAEAYAQAVLASLTLSADGQTLPISLTGHEFPDRAAMLEGLGTIRLRASAPLKRTSGGQHRVEYANAFRRDASLYLANALVPNDALITIERQDRDQLQQRLTITYDIAYRRTRRTGAVAASLTVLLIIIGRRRRASTPTA